jgi:hypothetical protein
MNGDSAGSHAAVDAELLGVGPAFLPDEGAARRGPVALNEEILEDTRGGLLETLGILDRIVRDGRFPFRAGRHCGWCAFDRACRRRHYPTRRRVEGHPGAQDYFLSQRKKKTRRFLADVPRNEEFEEEEAME